MGESEEEVELCAITRAAKTARRAKVFIFVDVVFVLDFLGA